jgi:hypothetical protein
LRSARCGKRVGVTARQLPPDYPPVLYIPCLEHVTDAGTAQAEYRSTQDGRTALLVYSALDRLHHARGNDQPWFLLPTKDLQMLYDVRPFDVVYLDALVPGEERRERSPR